MSSEQAFDEKGKVKPKRTQKPAEPEKANNPVTLDDVQGKLDSNKLARMQKTVGNAAVQRFLAQRSGDGAGELDEETTDTIKRQRGHGQSLDEDVADRAGKTLGQDFSDVNVHTDSEADELSQQLGAKAFTTGRDIFFRDGAYEPGSSDGQRLIAHELTHVVQQGASPPSVQGKMTVNDPNDQYEAEADQVADVVMNQKDETAIQQQAEEEEEELQMQEMEEEEEEVQMQEMEEEEEEVQMQEEEEEEELPA